jgi:hypothetical protein
MCVVQAAQSFRSTLATSGHSQVLAVWRVIEKMLDKTAYVHKNDYLIKGEVEEVLMGMKKHGTFLAGITWNKPLILLFIIGVLPLYIASQNAVVIFRKIGNDHLTFEFFEATLPAKEVMNEANKIQVHFPANPRLLLASTKDVLSTFANLLSFFSTNKIDDALPHTQRGANSHYESRDVASPRYISEAIT